MWESTAGHKFTVGPDPRGDTLGRGTVVKLFLKDEARQLLNDENLRNIILRYSQFTSFPIYLEEQTKRMITVEVPVEEQGDVTSGEGVSPAERVEQTEYKWERVNKQKAIWLRPKTEVSDEQYVEFYKTALSPDRSDPFAWLHFAAEGEIEFKSIVYLPSTIPKGYYNNFYEIDQVCFFLCIRYFQKKKLGNGRTQ